VLAAHRAARRDAGHLAVDAAGAGSAAVLAGKGLAGLVDAASVRAARGAPHGGALDGTVFAAPAGVAAVRCGEAVSRRVGRAVEGAGVGAPPADAGLRPATQQAGGRRRSGRDHDERGQERPDGETSLLSMVFMAKPLRGDAAGIPSMNVAHLRRGRRGAELLGEQRSAPGVSGGFQIRSRSARRRSPAPPTRCSGRRRRGRGCSCLRRWRGCSCPRCRAGG